MLVNIFDNHYNGTSWHSTMWYYIGTQATCTSFQLGFSYEYLLCITLIYGNVVYQLLLTIVDLTTEKELLRSKLNIFSLGQLDRDMTQVVCNTWWLGPSPLKSVLLIQILALAMWTLTALDNGLLLLVLELVVEWVYPEYEGVHPLRVLRSGSLG